MWWLYTCIYCLLNAYFMYMYVSLSAHVAWTVAVAEAPMKKNIRALYYRECAL